MRRYLAAAVTAVALVVPTAAFASPVLHREAVQYGRAYAHVVQKLGRRAAGCKLIGPNATCHDHVTLRLIEHSVSVLHRELAPPPAPAFVPTYATPVALTPAPAASYASSGYSIPSSIVQCESGGNWSAVNSSSGAGGAYQILPSTWAAYGGTGLPQDASPAEQSKIAGEIWAKQGSSAWTC